MTDPQKSSSAGAFVAIGAALLAVVCCAAGPALLAGGLLTGAGSALGSPWLIVGGLVVLAAAVVFALTRSRKGQTEEDCCAPQAPGMTVESQDAAEKKSQL